MPRGNSQSTAVTQSDDTVLLWQAYITELRDGFGRLLYWLAVAAMLGGFGELVSQLLP